EGSRAEVAELLRRVAEWSAANGCELQNREVRAPIASGRADAGAPAEPRAEKGAEKRAEKGGERAQARKGEAARGVPEPEADAPAAAPPTVRVVLRFVREQ